MLLYEFSSIEEEQEYLRFLAKFIDEEILLAMREVLGEKMYFVLYLLAGKQISFPSKTRMVKKIQNIRSRLYGKVKRKHTQEGE